MDESNGGLKEENEGHAELEFQMDHLLLYELWVPSLAVKEINKLIFWS